MKEKIKLEKKLKETIKKVGSILPSALIAFVFCAGIYMNSPNYKYNLKENDKVILIKSEAIGFPVIRDTYGIDRGNDGTIDEYFDFNKALTGKFVAYNYSKKTRTTIE